MFLDVETGCRALAGAVSGGGLNSQVLLAADVDVVLGKIDVQVRDDDGADGVGPPCPLHAACDQDAGRACFEVAALLADLHGMVDAEVNVLQPLPTACGCSNIIHIVNVSTIVTTGMAISIYSNIYGY